MDPVLRYSGIKGEDLANIGQKALLLADLYNRKYNVPLGFVVAAQVFDEVVEPVMQKIHNLLSVINIHNDEKLVIISQEIKKLIEGVAFPDGLRDEISEAYHSLNVRRGISISGLLKDDKPASVIVRGSPIVKIKGRIGDPGNHLTRLNVVGEDKLFKAIRECYASLFSAKSIKERVQRGLGHAVSTAVLVQQMIQTGKSGTAATANPESGNVNEVVIHAQLGLGHNMDPQQMDMYLVNQESMTILKTVVRNQRTIYRMDSENLSEKSLSDGSRQKLTDKETLEVARLARRIEVIYRKAVSVDWGICEDTVFLLGVKALAEIGPEQEFDEVLDEVLAGKARMPGEPAENDAGTFDAPLQSAIAEESGRIEEEEILPADANAISEEVEPLQPDRADDDLPDIPEPQKKSIMSDYQTEQELEQEDELIDEVEKETEDLETVDAEKEPPLLMETLQSVTPHDLHKKALHESANVVVSCDMAVTASLRNKYREIFRLQSVSFEEMLLKLKAKVTVPLEDDIIKIHELKNRYLEEYRHPTPDELKFVLETTHKFISEF
ncbi:MAG: PEP/pyruvate-binding domain-containing protein [archaeon]